MTMLMPTVASAAEAQQVYPLTFSGSDTDNIFDIGPLVCDECIPDLFVDVGGVTDEDIGLGAQLSADIRLDWNATATDTMSYNDVLLRQGQTLDAEHTMVTGPGTIDVKFLVSGAFGVYAKDDELNPPNTWLLTDASVGVTDYEVAGTSIPCVMPLPGESPRTCNSGQVEITVVTVPVFPGLDVGIKLKFNLSVEVDGSGVMTLRRADIIGGSTIANDPLTFEPVSPDVVADPIDIPCTTPVGNELEIGLTGNSYDAAADLNLDITPALSVIIVDPFPDFDWDITTISVPLADFDLTMTAPDVTKVLGPIAIDNEPPVADAGGPYLGNFEGTAVQFDGTGSSDNCGFPTLRWDFSDGGVAFGPNPQHTFADNGVYSGLLTATDPAGNTDTETFSVTVGNVAPAADAGPDGSGAWGRLIQFNGAGTDPGAADQGTLTYRWDFGDGSPSATGGPSVVHAYAAPGTYEATLRVTDKNGAWTEDTREVVVRKRATSLGSIGGTAGTFDTATSLSASLVDEFGQTVNGRTVTLAVGSDVGVASQTNSSGVATAAYTPGLGAGPYTLSAAFATDDFYFGSAGSTGYTIGKKATTVTYTGALTGGANKTIVLSAKLVDATGTALAARTINFKLGTQTASAVTDASGNASTTLKLAQKNGTYTVSATWTPGVGDSTKYVGSGDAKTFKLQTR